MQKVLSPHLQIYKLPLVAILSITHRFTGVILFIFFLLLCYLGAVVSALSFLGLTFDADLISTYLGEFFIHLALYAFVISLLFHLLNGIRHLMWGCSLFLSLRSVAISNVLILSFTLIFGLLIFLYCDNIVQQSILLLLL